MANKLGRPRVESPNEIVKSIRINKELVDKVDDYRKQNKLSFGEVVRLALEEFLKK